MRPSPAQRPSSQLHGRPASAGLLRPETLQASQASMPAPGIPAHRSAPDLNEAEGSSSQPELLLTPQLSPASSEHLSAIQHAGLLPPPAEAAQHVVVQAVRAADAQGGMQRQTNASQPLQWDTFSRLGSTSSTPAGSPLGSAGSIPSISASASMLPLSAAGSPAASALSQVCQFLQCHHARPAWVCTAAAGALLMQLACTFSVPM